MKMRMRILDSDTISLFFVFPSFFREVQNIFTPAIPMLVFYRTSARGARGAFFIKRCNMLVQKFEYFLMTL